MKNNILLLFLVSIIIVFLTGCPLDKKEETYDCNNPQATNYNPNTSIPNNCLCKYDGINPACNIVAPNTLIIPPVQQETEVWCWLAIGEMIFKYYGLPNINPGGDYQCGIIGAVGYSQNGACDACNINCRNCIRPAGSSSMTSYMLTVYPKVACRNLNLSNRTLKQSFVSDYLSANFLISELDQHRPVIAGINPGSQFVLPGGSQHVALIKGYYFDVNNQLMLRVNDPYPYETKGVDPYGLNGAIANGDLSYQISFVNFVNGLKWNTSWYNIGW